jgi:DNA-binding winged helix-turn-helix (wHTH) protein
MRVNSTFKGFFNNRLMAGYGITMVMPAILFLASSFTNHPDPDLRAKQVNLLIRQIGHQLLLQAGDSTSRVLPVTEIKEGTFQLAFENEFVFNNDSLMMLTERLLPKRQFPSGYTVTVHDCVNATIVYGFQVGNTTSDITACRGRHQPSGCFIIEFTFPDFYESVAQKKEEQKEAGIEQLAGELKPSKVDPQVTPLKPEAVKTTTFNDDTNAGTQESQSLKADLPEANSKPEDVKTITLEYRLINLVSSGILVLLGVTFLIGRFGRNLVPIPMQSQNSAIIKESVPEVSALGKFIFDVKGQRLLLGSEVTSLTDKECKVLGLLNKNFGELIPRETLMQKVWINEGVITGRSLDMFVSKLRKKLSGDPELRITNVHGKGYKLEIPGQEIS